MTAQIAHHTECGDFRESNQDAFLVKMAESQQGKVIFAVVCDGMGGLSFGELASSELVQAFDSWFWYDLPELLNRGFSAKELSAQWNGIVQGVSHSLKEYGHRYGCSVGTTVTALLLFEQQYYLLHVGDCRAYLLGQTESVQLTEDQTVAARELRAGRITPEQFATDSRQNMLTQCVGVGSVTPDFLSGACAQEQLFLLCSDGFYHGFTQSDARCLVDNRQSAEGMQRQLVAIGENCRRKGERDNMTAICIAVKKQLVATTIPMPEHTAQADQFQMMYNVMETHAAEK